jgi:hypothetical protein
MKIKKTTLLRSFSMKALQQQTVNSFGMTTQNVTPPPILCENDCFLNERCSDNTNGGKICSFGGGGGDDFVGLGKIKKIQLFGGEIVHAISINGTKYGGSGGYPSKEIILDDDEYISEVSVAESFGRYGQVIGFLEFITSKGKSIKNGKPSIFNFLIKLKNIKVTEISGGAGSYLDSIAINYINK